MMRSLIYLIIVLSILKSQDIQYTLSESEMIIQVPFWAVSDIDTKVISSLSTEERDELYKSGKYIGLGYQVIYVPFVVPRGDTIDAIYNILFKGQEIISRKPGTKELYNIMNRYTSHYHILDYGENLRQLQVLEYIGNEIKSDTVHIYLKGEIWAFHMGLFMLYEALTYPAIPFVDRDPKRVKIYLNGELFDFAARADNRGG